MKAGYPEEKNSVMTRIIEIIAVIILILLIISMAAMPWPANVILGSIALISSIMAFAYSWLAKKKERDTKQDDNMTDR